MAKIRVYELARDLNMGNKELIEKISAMDISVKSHMSSLDEEVLAQIKTGLLGKQVEEVEETRVRPTVIRRRRRAVVREVPIEELAESAEEAPEDAEITADPGVDVAPEAEVPESVSPEAEADSEPLAEKEVLAPDESVEAAAVEAEDDTPEPVAEEEPPDVSEAPADTEEPTAVEVEEDSQREPEPELPALETTSAEAVETPAVSAEETAEAEEITESAKEAPKNKAAAKEKSVPAAQIAKRIAKAGKKDAPAKIVQIADADEVLSRIQRSKAKPAKKSAPAAGSRPAGSRPAGSRPPAAERPAGARPKAEVIPLDRGVAAEPTKKDKKRKGKGRGRAPEENESKPSRRKTSFRKKAVVEGADLYDKSQRSRKGRKGAKSKSAIAPQKTQITTAKAIKRRIKIDDAIVLSELAKRMGIKANELIRTLMGMGVMATVNQTVDFDTAVLVAGEFGYEVGRAAFEEDIVLNVEQDDPDLLEPRSPVVTIMGHVDHGKTSLLDVIRKTRITEMEAGGITQHIGAYSVDTKKGRITFLDTPGHEAFTSMRSRGAKVTDIVVLVVAADDGVMPQTVEAINHSKAAGVPIIVAVNKIDKANADPAKVQRELAENGLVSEAWGGDTIYVEVSAKQNTGIDELLEMILLQSEVLELKANREKFARGHVVEAKLDSGRGPVATILIQEGTLQPGLSVVCGLHHGRIRALLDHRGQNIASAGPSEPVEVIGLTGVPDAGDELVAVADEKDAKQVSMHRIQKQRAKELAKSNRLSLDNLFDQIKEGQVKELSLIVKADVHGSIEALRDSLVNLSNEEVKINVIHSATGAISESDVSLAAVSDAIIIGFNVRPGGKVQVMAQEENVDIRYYNVIYNVIKDVKDAIVGMMDSTFEERMLGAAEVRQVFHIPKIGTIAGCYVTDGKIERGRLLRLVRDGVVQYEGKNSSLRRYKDDAKEVASGYECGIGIENYNDIKVGDVIECYYLEEIKPELD